MKLIFLLLYPCTSIVFCQDCKMTGQQCEDVKDCCGGCCIQEICIDTYEDCTLIDDLCLTNYCPPGFDCLLYKPCTACEVERNCQPSNEKSMMNKTRIRNHTNSSTGIGQDENKNILSLIILYFVHSMIPLLL